MCKKIILLTLIACLSACSGSNLSQTAYPNEYSLTSEEADKVNKVMLVTINFDKPGRHYLKRHQTSVDKQIIEYINDHDIKVTSNRVFKSQWAKVKREYGDMFNPSTGLRTDAFKPALQDTLSDIFKRYPDLDLVLFSDLIEVPIQYGNASNRIAQWHGVNRKVKVQGVGEAIDHKFNWLDKIEGISVKITAVDRQQTIVFQGIGGIQPVQAIDLHNKIARFKRRNDLLVNESEINEGIALSLHPLIKMKNHPGYAAAE